MNVPRIGAASLLLPRPSLLCVCATLLTLLTKSQIAKVFACQLCQLQLQLELHLRVLPSILVCDWVILVGTPPGGVYKLHSHSDVRLSFLILGILGPYLTITKLSACKM